MASTLHLARALLLEADAICRQDAVSMRCPPDASLTIATVTPWTDLVCRNKWGVRDGRSCRKSLGSSAWCADYANGRQTGLVVDCVNTRVTTTVNGRPDGLEVRWQRFPHGEGVSYSFSEWERGVQHGNEYERTERLADDRKTEVVRVSHYRRGRENGLAETWVDGRLTTIRTFERGKQSGLQVDFHPDGTIKTLEIWRNSRLLYRAPESEGTIGL